MGAKQNVVNSINRLVGKGVITDVADLGDFMKMNTELQKRISNIQRFYDDTKVQSELFKLIGAITKNFKVVLATPRRSVRDFYNVFFNFITHFIVGDQLHGTL